MSSNIKVTLPDDFNPDERAFFYQSLSALNFFLLPGTNVFLLVKPDEEEENKNNYLIEINFNKTVVKTSTKSESYHTAIKKMMDNLQNKFAEILEVVAKGKASEGEKSSEEVADSDDDKIIH